jgi:type II secretory pathway component PulF
MPQYRYKARDKEGALHTGTMEAPRKEAVADQLSLNGYIPVQIEEYEQSGLLQADLLARLTRVSHQDLIIFSRQLATLMGAGISFMQSLATIERQVENPRLKGIIAEIKRDIEAGLPFSEALARHPRVFSKLYVSMVRAGETAGILDDILNRLIVIVAISAAFVFLVTFVIPKFAAIFARFQTQLPLPTRILIGINTVFHHYWYLVLLGGALLVAGAVWYLRTPGGRWQWDGLKLKLPVFGVLFQKVALSRFARVFGAMQKSGLSMLLTLDIVAETVGNVVISRVVEQMRESLRQGKTLREPMEASDVFPPLLVQMVAVGEEAGNLDEMLNKVSDYYDMDVEYALRNLSTMIEPILLLFVGGMVLFLALGIFLPMWNMISLFKK